MIHQAASKDCSRLAGIDLVRERWTGFEDARAYWMFVQLGNGCLSSFDCKHKLACFGSFVWISISSLREPGEAQSIGYLD